MLMFDVGANDGRDSLERVANDSSIVCHAFEPTPELIFKLYCSSMEFGARYRIHPIALSDFDGKATFNIAGNWDWGTSSLNEFSERLDVTWPGRADLKVTHRVEVPVFRLQTLYERRVLPEQEIDHFHCDVQGSDLKVLRGMGRFISLIRSGVVEVPASKEVMLYKGQHTKEEMAEFLAAQGFTITSTTSQLNELNYHFTRNDLLGLSS